MTEHLIIGISVLAFSGLAVIYGSYRIIRSIIKHRGGK